MSNRILAAGLVLAFMLFGCGGGGGGGDKSHSGTVNANDEGKIIFDFENSVFTTTVSCKFTTDLPSPNDTFSLSSSYYDSNDSRIIEGLTPGQTVNWTAKSDYYIRKQVSETGTVGIFLFYDE